MRLVCAGSDLAPVARRLESIVAGRFPVRVDPVPGEAIDSWLEATARSMDVTVGSIARKMELPATTRPLWISWLTRAQVDAIASAAGIPHSVVESMTLAAYDGSALQLDPNTHRVSEASRFMRTRWPLRTFPATRSLCEIGVRRRIRR